MNAVTRKNNIIGIKSPSKTNLVRSKSTDHLTSTHQKGSSKKMGNEKFTNGNQISMSKILLSSKSKSHKSLKVKSKQSISKPVEQKSASGKKTKKAKKTSISDCKTVKKLRNIVNVNLSEESFSSLESSKTPIEYFLYQNTYVPIENSAQRRFVCKIKEIDMKNESTSDGFFEPKLALKDGSVGTEKSEITEVGTQMTPRVSNELQMQTQNVRFMEDTKKCFSQTLEDLEFLFLPDERNFCGFSKQEKMHYKQLLESISKKIWRNGRGEVEELTEEKLQMKLCERECQMMGMIEGKEYEGFPTHAYSIMSYLNNLFGFTEQQYAPMVLQRIQFMFGFTHDERLSRVLSGRSTKRECHPVLSEEVFMSLETELFRDHEFSSELIEKSVHIHNKAIFDAANEELQKFKPFYATKGEPFPWSGNLGMTFFNIDQASLPLLLKQVKEKILIKTGSLCGMIIDYDEFTEDPATFALPEMHRKTNAAREGKIVTEQISELHFTSEVEETQTQVRSKITDLIFMTLITEMASQLREEDDSIRNAMIACAD